VKIKKSLKSWLNELEVNHSKKIDLGLKRVAAVFQNLNLAKIAPVIISVAGTNGKGSTVAMLSAIGQKAGYKVGEFTSPHILKYNERIKINSIAVSDEVITTAFELIEQNLNGISLSYFEYSTLAAAIVFKQEGVDIAVLEVGLGGRLDSTNVIDSDCAIITTISIDHTDWLGSTIDSIAFEKAGIMRKKKPVIYGDKKCPDSIVQHAKKCGANLILTGNSKFTQPFKLNIEGDYQQKNAKTAVVALKALNNKLYISDEDIKKGLLDIKLSGRLEVISTSPSIIIDVSHNEQAAQELSHWLQSNPIDGKTIAVFAVLADKNAGNWFTYFKDVIDVWCISEVENPRAMAVKELMVQLANSATLITSFPSVLDAMAKAKIMASSTDRILVFGSFYTVSDAMDSINNNSL
jgi:dihydrofolate synthase/folylpolyglutamate synthase